MELLNQNWGGPGRAGNGGAYIWQKDGPCQGHCAFEILMFWKEWREYSQEPQITF